MDTPKSILRASDDNLLPFRLLSFCIFTIVSYSQTASAAVLRRKGKIDKVVPMPN
jgi:hypothetical protein